ncbi:hypothetical protein BD560DRAFT_386809 [Blakeslea trispora]|nr:hypothetical protein BD560DRAFT_386809 [Blakeslea trispora]
MNQIDFEKLNMLTYEESLFNINRLKCAHNWHTIAKFQNLIHNIDFADLRNRDDILYNKKILWEMSDGCYSEEREAIFTVHEPFPKNECYIYVYAPEYVEIITRMKKRLKRMQDKIWMEKIEQYVDNTKEMVNAFYDDVATLKKMVHDQVHVYDRAKFEKTFRVDWDLMK